MVFYLTNLLLNLILSGANLEFRRNGSFKTKICD